jgi:cytosolic carboxypeptidase protein 2/3
LILQNDINSKGHTQWFYFRVQNTKKGQRVKFNLLNFLKSKSLFNEGMKVLILSEKKLDSENVGWHRSGEDIAYYQNNYRRESMTNYQRCYYTFTFSYKFEHDNDTVYFAYSQPYSYSDLMDDLSEIEKK